MQGMFLYKEISLECIRCNMRRKRFLEVKMGGVKTKQLIVAPPFWACQVDLFGPYKTFVPGHEKQTRNKQMLECQVWVLAVVCPTTRLVNLQVVEKTNAGGIICGITTSGCETGLPKHMRWISGTFSNKFTGNREISLQFALLEDMTSMARLSV